jgi:hypothetical protein
MRARLACWVYGLFFVAVSIPNALADVIYTYEFTANPGQVTWYNGTTIGIDVIQVPPAPPSLFYNLVYLDFHGALDLAAWGGNPWFGPAPASLTPFAFTESSHFYFSSFNISDANAFGWAGSFSGYGGGAPQDNTGGDWEVSSSGVIWGPDTPGTGQPIIVESATGTWSLVPDAGSSFELLAAALAALAAGRHLQVNVTTDFTDFTDKKVRLFIREIREIRGQKPSPF